MLEDDCVPEKLSILVPFTDSSASRRALEVALRMARSEKRYEIYTMYVVEVDRRLALDVELPAETALGEQCLAEAEQLVRNVDLRCTGALLQARDVGHAVVDEAVTRGVDIVVLGIPEREFAGPVLDIGRTTEYVLRHAPCAVVIVRDGVSS